MNLEQLIQLLDQDEQTEFETPVSESQAGGDSKAIRGRLARLAIGVLKRVGQNPNPGPIIGQFYQLYVAASAPASAKLDLPQDYRPSTNALILWPWLGKRWKPNRCPSSSCIAPLTPLRL